MGFNLSKLMALFISMILLAIHSGSIWPVHEKPTELWSRIWGGINEDGGYDLTVDGSYIYIVGLLNFREYGESAFLAKYDTNGNQLWNTTWGGTGREKGYDIDVEDGNIYITGYTQSFGSGKGDVFLIKYGFPPTPEPKPTPSPNTRDFSHTDYITYPNAYSNSNTCDNQYRNHCHNYHDWSRDNSCSTLSRFEEKKFGNRKTYLS